MKDIDRFSDGLIRNEKKAYESMGELLENIGIVLDDCMKHLDAINNIGFQVSANDIIELADRMGTGLNKKDNMLMIDILCFELYGLIQAYVESGCETE